MSYSPCLCHRRHVIELTVVHAIIPILVIVLALTLIVPVLATIALIALAPFPRFLFVLRWRWLPTLCRCWLSGESPHHAGVGSRPHAGSACFSYEKGCSTWCIFSFSSTSLILMILTYALFGPRTSILSCRSIKLALTSCSCSVALANSLQAAAAPLSSLPTQVPSVFPTINPPPAAYKPPSPSRLAPTPITVRHTSQHASSNSICATS